MRYPKAAIALLLLAAAVAAGAAGAAEPLCRTSVGYRTMHLGGRVVAVWYPTTAHESAYAYGPKFSGLLAHDAPASTACGNAVPLVVFSHGDLGCGLQSVAFTEELARNGYVVAAPDHADAALCHTTPSAAAGAVPQPRQPPILDPSAWDASSRVDRRDDVEAVIDGLLNNPEFQPVIDARHIGLAGHSLGGYTVVGIAGGWPSWLDQRIHAVLALSPYVMPFQVQKTLANVRVPLMYQGGTLDVGITPFLQGAKGAFADARSPAYLIVLRSAGHFAWVNCGEQHSTQSCLQDVTNMRLATDYGIAFFNRYLKGQPQPLLESSDRALAAFHTK
jgi:predicted dienelactone hydrolase